MKVRILTLVLVLLSMGSPVLAQSQKMKVNVPFSFYLGEKKIPAGEYYIRQITEGAVALTDSRGAAIAVTSLVNKESAVRLTASKLQFEKIGDEYFLARVVDGTRDLSLVLPVTHTQKELARKSPFGGMEYQGSK